MKRVDRAHFVANAADAYYDAPFSIGHGVTISAPHMHAMCLELLEEQLRPGARALDVGSGSGFLAVAMALMTESQGKVHAIDVIEPLVEKSIENVRKRY